VHRRRGVFLLIYLLFWPLLFILSTVLYVIRKCFGAIKGKFSRTKVVKKKPSVLGYIPVELFIVLCAMTLGVYPFIWLWGNSGAFINFCGNRLQEKRLRRFSAAGFCIQLLLPASIILYVMWRLTGMAEFIDYTLRCSAAYVILYTAVIFPQRCYYYFDLRWNMRSAVEAWDSERIMIGRTMTSWLNLFVFGSAYIQLHMNRLIGLGMPGFAGQDEILPDFSVSKWMREYVIRRPVPVTVNELQEKADG
jgi:hypothetical protein